MNVKPNTQGAEPVDLLSKVVLAKDLPWQKMRFPGCEMKTLLFDPKSGLATMLMKMDPGAVTMSFSSLAAALPLMDAGKIRAVAVTSKERMPQLPNVAPLSEGAPGLADYELLNWFGLFITAGTPQPIVDRLNGVINAALRDKTIVDKLMPQGIVPKTMTPAEYKAFVESETAKFG